MWKPPTRRIGASRCRNAASPTRAAISPPSPPNVGASWVMMTRPVFFAEAMTVAYRNFHGVETRIVRIFNTYGPRMRANDGRIVPSLINQALAGEPLTVFGDGSQTRSFCYVSDLVDGIYRLLLSDQSDPCNVGNPAEMTVMQFAETIRRLTGTRSTIVHKPLPVDDPKQRRPDISLAKAKLGWEPKVGLEEGLAATIDYFRALRG